MRAVKLLLVELLTLLLFLGFGAATNSSCCDQLLPLKSTSVGIEDLPGCVISHLADSYNLSPEDVSNMAKSSQELRKLVAKSSRTYRICKLWQNTCSPNFKNFYVPSDPTDSEFGITRTVHVGYGTFDYLNGIPDLSVPSHLECFTGFLTTTSSSYKLYKLRITFDARALDRVWTGDRMLRETFFQLPYKNMTDGQRASNLLGILRELLSAENRNVVSEIEVQLFNALNPQSGQRAVQLFKFLIPSHHDAFSAVIDSRTSYTTLRALLPDLMDIYQDKAHVRLEFRPLLKWLPSSFGPNATNLEAIELMTQASASLSNAPNLKSFGFCIQGGEMLETVVAAQEQLIPRICTSAAHKYKLLCLPPTASIVRDLVRTLSSETCDLRRKSVALNFDGRLTYELADINSFVTVFEILAYISRTREYAISFDADLENSANEVLYRKLYKFAFYNFCFTVPRSEIIRVNLGSLSLAPSFAIANYYARQRAGLRRGFANLFRKPRDSTRHSLADFYMAELPKLEENGMDTILSRNSVRSLEWRGFYIDAKSIERLRILHYIPQKPRMRLSLEAFSHFTPQELDSSLQKLYSYIISFKCKLTDFDLKLNNVVYYGGISAIPVSLSVSAKLRAHVVQLLQQLLQRKYYSLKSINGYPTWELMRILQDSNTPLKNILY